MEDSRFIIMLFQLSKKPDLKKFRIDENSMGYRRHAIFYLSSISNEKRSENSEEKRLKNKLYKKPSEWYY